MFTIIALLYVIKFNFTSKSGMGFRCKDFRLTCRKPFPTDVTRLINNFAALLSFFLLPLTVWIAIVEKSQKGKDN